MQQGKKLFRNSSRLSLILCLAILTLSFSTDLSFSQSNQHESLTISTYYPSPNAVFNSMEVRGKIIVGNITDSHTAGISTLNDIKQDQVYVTESLILGNQAIEPDPSTSIGQLFFNGTAGKLEFNHGTWHKLGGG